MNIVFFGWVRVCDPMKIGGSESLTRRLALSLSCRGHNVAVIMYGADKDCEIKKLFGNTVTVQYYCSFYDALKCLSDLRYDFVFEMYIQKRFYFSYLIFKRKMKAYMKFSIIFMTAAEGSIKQWLRNKFRVKFCNPVFAVSPRLIKELQKKGIPAVWLPPPVPDHYFTVPREMAKKKIIISYIGRIDANKGVDSIIKVFRDLQNSPCDGRSLEFKIYGYYDSNRKESIALHNSLQKLPGIEYFARRRESYQYSLTAEEQMLDFILGTDILILPYKNLKGTLDLPLLLLEGLAARCIVISTDVGDVPEIIGNQELIVKSCQEMKEKIRNLACLEELKKHHDRIQAMNLFSIFTSARVAEKLLQFAKF